MLFFFFLLFLPLGYCDPAVWLGAVTPTSFIAHVDIPPDTTSVGLFLTSSLTNPVTTQVPSPSTAIEPTSVYSPLHRFEFSSLTPNTLYHLALLTPTASRHLASLRTYPSTSSPVILGMGSCQYSSVLTGSWPSILSKFAAANTSNNPPAMTFIQMGDLHYSDITRNDVSRFERAARKVITTPSVHSLFSSIPVVYMYDDHDYGGNNADFFSPSRQAALDNYRTFVPNYPLPSNNASYFAFTIANVRVIMSDLRSLSRSDKDSMLGTAQREWLFAEFARWKEFDIVVWMSSKPWIGDEKEGDDGWRGFPTERRMIANRIKELQVENLVVIAGDAHVLAADDGSNADYADGGGGGFPVFQAAPIAHVGTTKGGRYSEGCVGWRFYPNFQFGLLRIEGRDSGEGSCVRFEGYSANIDEPRLVWEKCDKLGGVRGTNRGTCKMSFWPWWIWIVILLLLGFIIPAVVSIIWICRKKRKIESATDDEQKAIVQDDETTRTLENKGD